MNIFLPVENNIKESVKCLDNARLVKQILECKTLLENAIACKDKGKGYSNHPVSVFYQDNPDFVAYYGLMCCEEYELRFMRWHNLHQYYVNYFMPKVKIEGYDLDVQPKYTPYYMEGSKNDSKNIRTNSFVSELFQAKLITKWTTSKKEPKWTSRNKPKFFQEFLEKTDEEKNEYAQQIENLKNQVRAQQKIGE